MSQKLTKDELEIKLGKAKKLIADLCEGKQKWTMRIPVDRNNDSDFILSDAIDDLLSHISALEEENEKLIGANSALIEVERRLREKTTKISAFLNSLKDIPSDVYHDWKHAVYGSAIHAQAFIVKEKP